MLFIARLFVFCTIKIPRKITVVFDNILTNLFVFKNKNNHYITDGTEIDLLS